MAAVHRVAFTMFYHTAGLGLWDHVEYSANDVRKCVLTYRPDGIP